MRTVLIDQEALFRHFLRQKLEEMQSNCRVVAEGGLGMDALALCQEFEADLLVMDHCLMDVASAEVVAQLRKERAGMRVLLLGCHHTQGLLEAIAAGAHGCVLKSESLAELQTALQLVSAGANYFSPKTNAIERPRQVSLTQRQKEILAMIASGCSTKQVAAKLSISFKTADHHRARIMKKLGRHDLAGLVRFAVATGLVLADSPGEG